MADYSAFYPVGDAVTVAGSTTSANKEFAPSGTPPFRTVRVANTTTGWAYVKFGGSSVAATVAAGQPIPPSEAVVFRVDSLSTYGAAILSTGTGNVIFTPGDGGR